MMKASDPRQPDDIGICGRSILCPPAIWRVAKAGVHSFFVVVVDILSKESPQVLLVDDYHVIKELSPHSSYPSFCDPVLPWASVGGSRRLDSDTVDCLGDTI
jgi:hypothetical protein